MFPEERRAKIVNILDSKGRCRVIDLAFDLDVSEVTVRQDLDALEKQGMLRRTHGGAILVPKTSFERPFQIEETSFKEEKTCIGKAAAELISEGDTVILDVGTTVATIVNNLNNKNITVLTNALNIATMLENYPNITTILTGGTLRAKQHSLINPYAHFILEKIYADIAFIGVSGVEAEHGITNVNIEEAEMKSLFIEKSRRCVVLADSSKIGNVSLAKVGPIDKIDLLITDNLADSGEIMKLKEKGIEVKQV